MLIFNLQYPRKIVNIYIKQHNLYYVQIKIIIDKDLRKLILCINTKIIIIIRVQGKIRYRYSYYFNRILISFFLNYYTSIMNIDKYFFK